jgi:allantoinase
MNEEMIIKRENLRSKSKVTAFDQFAVKGVLVATRVRGITVMEAGEIVSEPVGRMVKPGK